MRVAGEYAGKWRVLARGGREGASARDYGSNGTWSLKYNVSHHTLLNLSFTHDAHSGYQ